ncbi:MAG: NADH:ubiquinone reductase (Na(+)-transporting) subunit A [Calditerrivibrio sp.]|nr:NADH:ubiquinone reductase (Na(+)-transporting) subunit A [Calditerrivibrio sp.]MCA1932380.1 NADH:ubiquinone reductase (Na(+)-transporting) subunit A [Calditerrivibrio sp.]
MCVDFNRGLELPLPKNIFCEANEFKSNYFGIVGDDFVGLKPSFVALEDSVIKRGDLLFVDKNNKGAKFVSFVDGRVYRIVRGEKRRFISYQFEGEASPYPYTLSSNYNRLSIDKRGYIVNDLIDSGLWISLRERPFDKIANPEKLPDGIFVLLRDTRPYSLDYNSIINSNLNYIKVGLRVLSFLTDGFLYAFKDRNLSIDIELPNLKIFDIAGKHPSALVGTLINRFYPLNRGRRIWYIDYQDVIAIGKLYMDGIVDRRKIVSFCSELNNKGYLLYDHSHIGEEFSKYIDDPDYRVIAGTPLFGRSIDPDTPYINRYLNTISILKEAKERKFMGWLMPGKDRFSVKNVFISKILGSRINFDTSLNGSYRPMLPTGSYENVSQLDIPITYFLRGLLTGDIELCEKLGVLDFGEEDMAVFNFVSIGKIDYSIALRKILDEIESEL